MIEQPDADMRIAIEFVAEFYGIDKETAIKLYKDEIEAYEFFIHKEQDAIL